MEKPQKIYIILRGKYGDDIPHVHGSAFTKAEAGKLCRESGHKWDENQQLFLNDEAEGTHWWLRVVVTEVGKRNFTDRVSYGRPPGQKPRHFHG